MKGVEVGPGLTDQTATPFGTLFVQPLTATANKSSKQVGIAQGITITSSFEFDGLESISIAKVTLNLKDPKGSVSIVGRAHNINPSPHPVVEGTEDFLFVQGYMTSSPVLFFFFFKR